MSVDAKSVQLFSGCRKREILAAEEREAGLCLMSKVILCIAAFISITLLNSFFPSSPLYALFHP